MFSWLIKKLSPAAGAIAPVASALGTTTAQPGAGKRREKVAQDDSTARRADPAQAKAAQAAAHAAEDWPGRLQQALGDDAALMALAASAPGLDIRLAAVEGITGEDALRRTERALRTRDRKVHSLAKNRLAAAVARRTAHATAERLLQQGQGLLDDPHLPLNRLAMLERDWQALPAALLDAAQHQAFAALRTQWDRTLRARADAEQRLQRWTIEAQRSLPSWQVAVAAAGSLPPQEAHAALAAVRNAARALLGTQPAHASTVSLATALTQLLSAADTAQAAVDAPPPGPRPATEVPASEEDAAQSTPARQPAEGRKASADQCQQLEALLQQADAVVDEGQLAALQQHLQAAEALLAGAKGVQWPLVLRHRLQGLRAERLRLRAWQTWGGQRAREDLVAEAEALSQRVRPPDPGPGTAQNGMTGAPPAATADEAVPDAASAPSDAAVSAAKVGSPAVSSADDGTVLAALAPPSPTTTPDEATAPSGAPAPPRARSPRPKLNLRAHAEAIHALRMRWKALDKLGERHHGDLWERFDGALTAAYAPVATQTAAQQAARQQNLLARQALLDGMESLSLPDASSPAADPAWRDLIRQLNAFEVAWHQLGPVEHTAPAAARASLQQRLQAARDRVEQPLREARDRAVSEREQLIQHAEALALVDGRGLPDSERQRQLRRLQAEWQEHARRLPLQRGIESALWTRFRAAIDTVFAQRDAAAAAMEAEQAAEVAQREALIARLEALTAETPTAQIDSALGEVDRAWQQAPVLLPRGAGQALDTRYRDARAVAAGLASTAARLRWQAQVDACIASVQAAVDETPARTGGDPSDAHRVDESLLRLEIALDLPATPERQAARRQWKLRALKEAMEGSAPAADGPALAGRCLATLLGDPALDDLQRTRLLALLKALRDAPPGTLGLTFPQGLRRRASELQPPTRSVPFAAAAATPVVSHRGAAPSLTHSGKLRRPCRPHVSSGS